MTTQAFADTASPSQEDEIMYRGLKAPINEFIDRLRNELGLTIEINEENWKDGTKVLCINTTSDHVKKPAIMIDGEPPIDFTDANIAMITCNPVTQSYVIRGGGFDPQAALLQIDLNQAMEYISINVRNELMGKIKAGENTPTNGAALMQLSDQVSRVASEVVEKYSNSSLFSEPTTQP